MFWVSLNWSLDYNRQHSQTKIIVYQVCSFGEFQFKFRVSVSMFFSSVVLNNIFWFVRCFLSKVCFNENCLSKSFLCVGLWVVAFGGSFWKCRLDCKRQRIRILVVFSFNFCVLWFSEDFLSGVFKYSQFRWFSSSSVI